MIGIRQMNPFGPTGGSVSGSGGPSSTGGPSNGSGGPSSTGGPSNGSANNVSRDPSYQYGSTAAYGHANHLLHHQEQVLGVQPALTAAAATAQQHGGHYHHHHHLQAAHHQTPSHAIPSYVHHGHPGSDMAFLSAAEQQPPSTSQHNLNYHYQSPQQGHTASYPSQASATVAMATAAGGVGGANVAHASHANHAHHVLGSTLPQEGGAQKTPSLAMLQQQQLHQLQQLHQQQQQQQLHPSNAVLASGQVAYAGPSQDRSSYLSNVAPLSSTSPPGNAPTWLQGWRGVGWPDQPGRELNTSANNMAGIPLGANTAAAHAAKVRQQRSEVDREEANRAKSKRHYDRKKEQRMALAQVVAEIVRSLNGVANFASTSRTYHELQSAMAVRVHMPDVATALNGSPVKRANERKRLNKLVQRQLEVQRMDQASRVARTLSNALERGEEDDAVVRAVVGAWMRGQEGWVHLIAAEERLAVVGGRAVGRLIRSLGGTGGEGMGVGGGMTHRSHRDM